MCEFSSKVKNAKDAGAIAAIVVNVAQAGVYPLRCVWFEGGGGANIEWFSVTPSGQRILLNDRENASALKTYRARVAGPAVPTLSYTVNQAAGTITLTYTGVLQSSANVPGTYTDVAGASSPLTVPMTGTKFYRARSN